MPLIIHTLCALTALACTVLLLRSYRQLGHRLLLWSGICFAGLFLNNVLVIIDRYLVADQDWTTIRLVTALAALLVLVFGLVWEDQ